MTQPAAVLLLVAVLVTAATGALAGPRAAGAIPATGSTGATGATGATGRTGTPALTAAPRSARVVVIGVTGLRWDDVGPATPSLQRLAAAGSVGVLSVKTAAARDCGADAWLSLGAGDRVRTAAGPWRSCPDHVPGLAALPGLRSEVARLPRDAVVGELAVALGGTCVAADGPGALLSVAGTAVPACPATAASVQLVDAGIVHHDGRRAHDVVAADHRVAQAAAAGGTVLVVGVGESGRDVEHLHVAVAAGPGFGRGGLVSPSTRRAPYVQLIDVAPTVLQLLGRPQPAAMSGQPWRTSGAAPTRATLADLDVRAGAVRALTVPFFVGLVALIVLVLGASVATRMARTPLRLAALAAAAAPVAFFLADLVPWWRQDVRSLALLAAVSVADVVVVALAMIGPWRRAALGPVGVVCGGTALVLSADLVSGARLQIDSLAGYSPLVAGRFAGIGNVAFAVLATAGLLATACAVRDRSRRTTLVVCALVGLTLVAVDGSPSWGSDFGGVLALVPGFAVLAMLAARIRVSILRLALVGTSAVVLVAGFAVADYLRPVASRTHLGRFVDQLLHGGAGTVVGRKAGANLALLLHSPLTAVVPLLVLGLGLVVLRPRGGALVLQRFPPWRAALLSVLVMALVGFVTNDSGVAVPALALALAVPATVAVGLGGAPSR